MNESMNLMQYGTVKPC